MVKIEREEDGKQGRFAIYDDGRFAGEMTYTRGDHAELVIDHTGIEEAFGGKGYGKLLLKSVIEYARKQGIKIKPLCPFVVAAFEKDESIRDVRIWE